MRTQQAATIQRSDPPPFDPPAIMSFIAGHWESGQSDRRHSVLNPATGEEIVSYAGSSAAQVDKAADAASAALDAWSKHGAKQRYAILRDAAQNMRQRVERIALALVLEQGKPMTQARAEVLGSADVLTWFAEQGRRLYSRTVAGLDPTIEQLVDPQPVGPIAVLTPWNSPLGTSVRTVAAGLAAGCTAVLKSASETPMSVMAFVDCMVDAGLPTGVLNVVFGDAALISERLIDHEAIAKISFTGSLAVGRKLAAQAGDRVKPLTLELGGHAPVLIFADADIDAAARQSVESKFDNAGQICISPSRFYVQDAANGRFVDAIVEQVAALQVGVGWSEQVDVGPLAHRRRVEEVDRLVKDAVGRGAKLRFGGERPTNRGFFFQPTVLSDVPDDAAIMTEEPFGPVVAIARFADEAEAMRRANALRFGLAAYAFTGDALRLERLRRGLQAGMVGLNNFAVSKPELPFTGVKASGYGYACGEEGLEGFVVRHTVTRRYGSQRARDDAADS